MRYRIAWLTALVVFYLAFTYSAGSTNNFVAPVPQQLGCFEWAMISSPCGDNGTCGSGDISHVSTPSGPGINGFLTQNVNCPGTTCPQINIGTAVPNPACCSGTAEGPVYMGGGEIDCSLCVDGIDNDCNGVKDNMEFACAAICSGSPILVDVDGSGFELTSSSDGVWFDFYGTGRSLLLSWTPAGSTNAYLALDRDGNGTIDSGRELFGNLTPQASVNDRNGFLALGEYDKPEKGGNGDRLISQNDAIFGSLRLWQDVNHNGVSEATELRTLPQLGVVSVDLDYHTFQRVDEYGNIFRYRSKVNSKHKGPLGRWAWDVFLTIEQ